MAKVTSVEFVGADTVARKAATQAFHHMHAMLLHGKKKGDHIVIHFDDGTSENYTMKPGRLSGDSWAVDVAPGVEP